MLRGSFTKADILNFPLLTAGNIASLLVVEPVEIANDRFRTLVEP